MANLFSRFSANIEQSQTVVEKQDNKALGALRNSLQVVKDSSEKAKAGIQSIDRTKVIEKTVALDYDKTGLYVCNRVYYEALYLHQRAIFIHIPRDFTTQVAANIIIAIAIGKF